jgi:hypothetical protein
MNDMLPLYRRKTRTGIDAAQQVQYFPRHDFPATPRYVRYRTVSGSSAPQSTIGKVPGTKTMHFGNTGIPVGA